MSLGQVFLSNVCFVLLIMKVERKSVGEIFVGKIILALTAIHT